MDVKTIGIDSIGLSNRSANALHRAGVKTVGEMLAYSEEALFGIRNMGRKSIDEVLLKIEEYRKYDLEGGLPEADETASEVLLYMPEDFVSWCSSEEGRAFILGWIREKRVKTGALELLSARAYNHLLLNKLEGLDQIIFLTADELMEIPRMDIPSSEEIVKMCHVWLKEHEAEILDSLRKKLEEASRDQEESLHDILYSKAGHDRILQYVQANDCDVETIGFSVRSKNLLMKNGYPKLSDFIFLKEKELKEFKGMGAGSLQEIQTFIDDYLAKHETRLKAFCGGDDTVIWDEESIRTTILDTYNKIGFEGLSLRELREKSGMPEQVPDEILKSVLGSLLADGTLEYVDFRCYRIYPKFADYLSECTRINDRTREIMAHRLQGETLEAIAIVIHKTRERVRQIIANNMRKIKSYLRTDKGVEWFDEDYYRYFFETYSFEKKDAEEWLGIDKRVFTYMEMTSANKGKKNLDEAQDDYHNLDLGLRLKIKNYLNRNRLFLDGRWVEKKRADLEKYVVRKYCRENVTFADFTQIYNDFLREEEIGTDEGLDYTDDLKHAVKRRLSEAKFLLWKYGEVIRCYDIDSHDYTELWEALNLDAYENIEYSTSKFMTDHPDIMDKYDIRDHYELHNLLRKALPEGSFHDFHCNRTPMVEFGKFDRNAALLDLLIDNAPISQADFAEVARQEYGYDPATMLGSYMQVLDAYYHQGMYTIDQKVMATDHKNALEKVLTDDFYYIDEIRKIYAKVVPGADLEEVNPYNLKTMGFSVLSRYVYRNHSSLDDYFRELLTRDDILDITPYRQRFAYVQSFSTAFVNLKNEMEIFEFEPNQIITYRKLAAAGVTKEDLQAFCDEAADFVEDGTYFSVQSIKKAGFESELFGLGFSDWFYASLLTSDDRFSDTRAFGNILLYKGRTRITIQSFEVSLIREHGSIDVYDLMTEIEEIYGCRITDRLDLIYKVGGTDVVYDKYMDRLYANNGILIRELDAAEGM